MRTRRIVIINNLKKVIFFSTLVKFLSFCSPSSKMAFKGPER